jgi:hypothetical protein
MSRDSAPADNDYVNRLKHSWHGLCRVLPPLRLLSGKPQLRSASPGVTPEELEALYPGQWVVLHEGQVILTDPDELSAEERARALGHQNALLVYVPREDEPALVL